MTTSRRGLRLAIFGLTAGALAAGLGLVSPSPATAADGLPSKMVFFTDASTCPDGTSRATQANGRLVIAVNDLGVVGNTVGNPLSDQENRTHTHSSTLTTSLSSQHIAGASSCCNGQATTHGSHSTDVTTDGAASNLPFIQLLACEVD